MNVCHSQYSEGLEIEGEGVGKEHNRVKTWQCKYATLCPSVILNFIQEIRSTSAVKKTTKQNNQN